MKIRKIFTVLMIITFLAEFYAIGIYAVNNINVSMPAVSVTETQENVSDGHAGQIASFTA